MHRIKQLVFVLAFVGILIGFGTAFTPNVAHAAQKPVAQKISASCRVLQVQLRGQQTPNFTCISNTPLKKGIHQNITTACVASTRVQVYSETNYTGYLLCLDGTGTLNFADIWEPWPFWNWNDNIMSYEAFSGARGTFYIDSNESGRSFSFSSGNYSLNLGSWNNVISSIRMY